MTFHSDNAGIHHFGFTVRRLTDAASEPGFRRARAVRATSIEKNGREYDVLLLVADHP